MTAYEKRQPMSKFLPALPLRRTPSRGFVSALSATRFSGMAAAALKMPQFDPVVPDQSSQLLAPGQIGLQIGKEGFGVRDFFLFHDSR